MIPISKDAVCWGDSTLRTKEPKMNCDARKSSSLSTGSALIFFISDKILAAESFRVSFFKAEAVTITEECRLLSIDVFTP